MLPLPQATLDKVLGRVPVPVVDAGMMGRLQRVAKQAEDTQQRPHPRQSQHRAYEEEMAAVRQSLRQLESEDAERRAALTAARLATANAQLESQLTLERELFDQRPSRRTPPSPPLGTSRTAADVHHLQSRILMAEERLSELKDCQRRWFVPAVCLQWLEGMAREAETQTRRINKETEMLMKDNDELEERLRQKLNSDVSSTARETILSSVAALRAELDCDECPARHGEG